MLTATLSDYISGFRSRDLPREVVDKGILHLVDTVAAMVSGSCLEAGRKIIPVVKDQEGRPDCAVVATRLLTTPSDAALANGIFAHADETDDSHAPSLTHPGCAVVPAALAMAEYENCNGSDLLRAIILGYDVGTRIAMALGGSRFADRYQLSSHAWGGTFGATAAASALAKLDASQTSHALSYAVQLASGNRCWLRDPDHVQKAFVFGGMPASSGVRSALLAAAGFTGVADALEGSPGLFSAFSEEAEPSLLTESLGTRFEIMRTSIKKWSVGSPVQAALDAIDSIVKEHATSEADIANITVSLPEQRARVVDSAMPNINLRHVLAVYLADGGVSFASLHDKSRMDDPGLERIKSRIWVEPRTGAARHEQAHLSLETTEGQVYRRSPRHVRGQPDDPMTQDEVLAKARDLVAPVLGESRGNELLHQLLQPDSIGDVKTLRKFWQ